MRTDNVLPVAFTSGPRLISDAAGDPVWPIWDEGHLDAICAVSSLFGLDVVEASAGEAEPRDDPARECVVALGSEAAGAALLYAHLTGRRSVVADPSDIDILRAASVVVTFAHRLTSALLDRLYPLDSGAARVPGIVCGSTPRELYQHVLTCSATLGHHNDPEIPWAVFLPLVPLPLAADGDTLWIGSGATPSQRREVLSAGAGVLQIVTHSDGVDANLGRDLTLCPMDRAPPEADRSRAPRCQETGRCHRYRVQVMRDERGEAPSFETLETVEAAWASGELVAPDDLRARVLLLNVCSGVRDPEGTLDPAWTLAARLLTNPGVGALITSWEIDLIVTEHVCKLGAALAGGAPAGAAVAEFNRMPESRDRVSRYCLFGEPRARACRAGSERTFSVLRAPEGEKAVTTFATFPALYLASEARAPLSAEAADAARAAAAAVAAYERALRDGADPESPAAPLGPAMRKSLLRLLLQRGNMICKSWLRTSKLLEPEGAPRACAGCGRATKAVVATLPLLGPNLRRVRMCPACRVVEDAPAASSLSLAVRGGDIHLHGELPRRAWTAGVMIDPTLVADRIGYELPAGDGEPPRVIPLPKAVRGGEADVIVFVLVEHDLVVVSQMMRLTPDRDPQRLARLEGDPSSRRRACRDGSS